MKYCEKFLKFLGICSDLRSSKPQKLFLRSINSYFPLVSSVFAIVFSTTFILEHLSEFHKLTNAVTIISAAITAIGSYFSAALNVNAIHRLHAKLQQLVDNGIIK